MEQAAHQEKSHAALSSVLWSAFLTVIKLWAGIVTGSLGIISEALHSGLDLMAAAMTFYAVKVASRPADESHPYGHEKVENPFRPGGNSPPFSYLRLDCLGGCGPSVLQ